MIDIDGVADGIGAQGSGPTLEGLKRDQPSVYAALLAQVQGEERKTLLEMLKEGEKLSPSGMEKDPRAAAASQMIGAPGGIQYGAYNPTGRLPQVVSLATDIAKLAQAAGGAGAAGA